MDNKFLTDFIKMRQQLNTSNVNTAKKPQNSLNKMPEPKNDMTLAYLISEKPARKEVIDYFRSRIDDLVAEEEAKSVF